MSKGTDLLLSLPTAYFSGLGGAVVGEALANGLKIGADTTSHSAIKAITATVCAASTVYMFNKDLFSENKPPKEIPVSQQLAEPVHGGMMQRNQVRLQLTDVAAR